MGGGWASGPRLTVHTAHGGDALCAPYEIRTRVDQLVCACAAGPDLLLIGDETTVTTHPDVKTQVVTSCRGTENSRERPRPRLRVAEAPYRCSVTLACF